MARIERLLITGAAGGLGRVAREGLGHLAATLRVSDIADLGPGKPHEEVMPCDLGDEAAVMDLVAGCDGIVHFGGVSIEGPFGPILRANVEGVYHLYEAARAHGVKRVFFASSNHAVGFHPTDAVLDGTEAPDCDGLYGASKVWGEQIARLYWHKFGIETARVRIGSAFPEPKDRRMLSTWMSHRDLLSLIERVFRVPWLGCPVIYGASANPSSWWDNGKVAYLGWKPQDTSEAWRAAREAEDPDPDPDDPAHRFQGGRFVTMPVCRVDGDGTD